MGRMRPQEASNARRTRDRAAARLAAVQHGVIGVAQAHRLGFDADAIAARVRNGRWDRVLPRVYRIAGAPERGRQAAMAATLWAGDGAVVSHEAAAVLWRLDGVGTTRVHVTVPEGRSPRHESIVVHRARTLPAVDRDVVHGVPTTSAARTLIDLAGAVDSSALERALESALRARLTRSAFVAWRLDDLGGTGRPGTPTLRRLLEERGRGAEPLESALEAAVWRVLVASDLPRPVRQHPVCVGGATFRLDFAWPDSQVALEADGYLFHAGRRAFVDDRARAARLVAAGWRIVPVTWDQVRDAPDELVASVHSAIAHASMKRESVTDRLSARRSVTG